MKIVVTSVYVDDQEKALQFYTMRLLDEGAYEDGRKVGEWKAFDKDGALKSKKVFKARGARG